MAKKCRRCGAHLIEENTTGSSMGSAGFNHSGSIKVKKVFRCPNSKCGYLSTD